MQPASESFSMPNSDSDSLAIPTGIETESAGRPAVPVVSDQQAQPADGKSSGRVESPEQALSGCTVSTSSQQRKVKLDYDELDIPRCKVWGVPFDCVTLPESIEVIESLIERGKPSYVITANLNYVMLHHEDPTMHAITEEADLILADGQPIVWRSQLDDQNLPERVAGSDMIFDIAERAADRGWKIYFLGGEEGVAAACAEKLVEKFPTLKIAGVESPPFRSLTADEQAAQDERIRATGADVLLVAFGQPKGERWIHEHHERLGVPVSIQLGASFDFIAGTATRAPAFWQAIGLEWFYRMCSDPKRLIARYWANAKFLCAQIRTEIASYLRQCV